MGKTQSLRVFIAATFFVSSAFAQSETQPGATTNPVNDAGGLRATIVGDPEPVQTTPPPAENTTATPTTTTNPALIQPQSSGNSNAGMILAGFGAACLGALAVLSGKNSQTADEIEAAAYRANDEAGYQDDDSLDGDFRRSLGRDMAARFTGSCQQKFIDKDGRLGPWGRIVRDEIRERKSEFVKNEPPDVMQMCPGYKNMDEKKREEFWIHAFMSLASPESSCNEGARNPNAPNGTAKGLFQLEKPVCDGVNVRGDLYDGQVNTRCAVRLLGVELARRDNLMSPTSRARDSRRTYWGPLRTDDHNRARGGDIQGAKKFRGLIAQFPGCK